MTGISDSRGPRLPLLHDNPKYRTPPAFYLVKFEIVMPISTHAGSKMQVRPQLNNINKDRGIDKETQQQRRRAAADRKGNLIWRCTDHTRGIPSSHGWARQFIGDAYSSLEEDYQYEVDILFQNKTLVSLHGEWLLVLIIGYFRLLMGIGIPKIDTFVRKWTFVTKTGRLFKKPSITVRKWTFCNCCQFLQGWWLNNIFFSSKNYLIYFLKMLQILLLKSKLFIIDPDVKLIKIHI